MLIPQPRKLSHQAGAGATAKAHISEIIDSNACPAQGYRLIVADGAISIVAGDTAGLFWAQQTLKQLRRQYPQTIPEMQIEDWPDFVTRGFMLDISRDKVPTMQTLFALVNQLAELKINQLQLYTEHTFAYRDHPVVWKDASPMTGEEIRQLDAYCRERFIELVPNQNSFGHLERWLRHPQYRHLAQKPDGFTFPSGIVMPSGFSLNPNDPRSIEFVASLFDELLPNFTSRLFNVGCDETYDVESGYLDFLLKIHQLTTRRGRTMMFWGDIILHKAELLDELPRDVIALNWGYEADHPFEKETRAFHDAGVPFYVCPGTSSWCSIAGRMDNAIANLKSAAEHGLKNGATGYLITDWGDYGHLQYLPVSHPGIAAGAAFSWCYQSNRDIELNKAIDMHMLGGFGASVLRDLGNVYQAARQPMSNGSRFFWALINLPGREKLWKDVTIEEYADALDRIARATAPLNQMNESLIKDEIRNAAAMLKHACRRGLYLRGDSNIRPDSLQLDLNQIISEHRRLWLARNRPGGLDDSTSRLTRLAGDYSSKP